MIAISALCAWPAIAQVNALVSVPSGQAITLQEVIVDESATGKTLRLRFVAPHIVQEGADMEAAKDMDSLCETVALPHLEALGTPVNQIVISLSDRPVPFGEISPDAVQFFEAYSVGDGTCIWEGL